MLARLMLLDASHSKTKTEKQMDMEVKNMMKTVVMQYYRGRHRDNYQYYVSSFLVQVWYRAP